MILISEDVWGPAFAELATKHPVKQDPDLWNKVEELKKELTTATALVVRNRTQVTADLLDAAPLLKVIARAGVGLDNIDINAADARGIVVVAGLGANATSVGELTVGLALSLTRNIPASVTETRSGAWNRTPGLELTGGTWGLLGCGATAIATARLLQGFDISFIAYDPFVKPDDPRIQGLNITLGSIHEVVKTARIISIHMPSTPDTNGLVNSALIAQMVDGVFIINVGRGEVINEADLVVAIKSGKVAGAGLDVRATEPPTTGELETLSNVLLTPHIAGITKESQAKINSILTSNIELALASTPATHAVGAHKESTR
jgi:D-3-phosphoglycerate dehydrogenase/(S)-sulfolactate dehydrogenase